MNLEELYRGLMGSDFEDVDQFTHISEDQGSPLEI